MKSRKNGILGLGLIFLAWVILACNLSAAKPTSTPSSDTQKSTRTKSPTKTAEPPALATPALEEGWTLYENEASGFAIALPPTWDKIDIDPQTINAVLDTMEESNPEIANLLTGQVSTLIASGVKFFGFDMLPEAAASGFNTNVNILVQSLGMEISLDYYMQVNVAQLENMSVVVKPISQERVEIAAGEAGELRYKMRMTTQTGQAMTVSTLQYIVVDGKTAYVITFTTTVDQEEKYIGVFEKIGQSFQLIK